MDAIVWSLSVLIRSFLKVSLNRHVSYCQNKNNRGKLSHSAIRTGDSVSKDESTFINEHDNIDADGSISNENPKQSFCRKRSCIAGILLVLVVATFGLGPVDLSLYKSDSVSSYSAGFSSSLEENSNVRIDFIMDGETVASHEILSNSSTKTFLRVNIGPLSQEGNRFTPFYKDFKVTFKANFDNKGTPTDCSASDSLVKVKGYVRQIPSSRHVVSIPSNCIMQNGSVSGTMDGELHMRIMGLCSIKKADSLAKAEVIKAVREYVVGQLNK